MTKEFYDTLFTELAFIQDKLKNMDQRLKMLETAAAWALHLQEETYGPCKTEPYP